MFKRCTTRFQCQGQQLVFIVKRYQAFTYPTRAGMADSPVDRWQPLPLDLHRTGRRRTSGDPFLGSLFTVKLSEVANFTVKNLITNVLICKCAEV